MSITRRIRANGFNMYDRKDSWDISRVREKAWPCRKRYGWCGKWVTKEAIKNKRSVDKLENLQWRIYERFEE